MYLYLFMFSQFSTLICAEIFCDIYQTWDSNLVELPAIYTIANYKLPSSRGRLIEANVSCPCNTKGNFCLRKCCLPDDAFTTNKECHPSDLTAELKPIEFKKLMNVTKALMTWVVYGSYCNSVIEKIDLSLPIPSEKDYCVDYFSDAKTYYMAKCVTPNAVESVSVIFTICLVISITFLLVTFLIYISFRSLHNLPGKILLGYVLSLLITDSFYVMLQVTMIYKGILCECSAYAVQFSFLATFFWLNVMCFDLWWTFSGNRAFNGLSKEKGGKRFSIYCLYAWGCPAIISTATFIIDNTDSIFRKMKPNLGRKNRCWFGDDVAVFYYFYSFISVLLCTNFIMFLHTTFIIIKHNKNQVKYLEGNGNRRHILDKEKRRFYVYLKLFLMMGINWLLEILSYFYKDLTPSIIWDVIDVCNMLQGVFIFIIFVCKRRVLVLLNKKILMKDNLRSNSSYYTNNTGNSSVLHKENSKSSLKIEMTTTRLMKCKQMNNNM